MDTFVVFYVVCQTYIYYTTEVFYRTQFIATCVHDSPQLCWGGECFNQSGEQFFSKATLAQFNISKQLWSQLMESNDCPNIQEVFRLADYVIRRDPEWTAASRAILSSIEYKKMSILTAW